MEIFGIISTILYNVSSILAVKKIIKQGHADDMMASFLYPWFGGSLTGFIYVLSIGDLVLSISFGLGVIFGAIIIGYKVFPRIRRTVRKTNQQD